MQFMLPATPARLKNASLPLLSLVPTNTKKVKTACRVGSFVEISPLDLGECAVLDLVLRTGVFGLSVWRVGADGGLELGLPLVAVGEEFLCERS